MRGKKGDFHIDNYFYQKRTAGPVNGLSLSATRYEEKTSNMSQVPVFEWLSALMSFTSVTTTMNTIIGFS